MPQQEPSYWLMKSEPDAYSIDTLKSDGVTLWDGIRNYQARNFMRNMKKGFMALCKIDCQSRKSSNEVRMEFSVKNKTLAMTSKMHLALFSLASS